MAVGGDNRVSRHQGILQKMRRVTGDRWSKPRTTDIRPCFRACPSGTSEHLPREIAAKGVFEVLTEEIISRGESLRLRTGCSGVRGKWI